MTSHGFSEEDWERADHYHDQKADRIAERERKTVNARESLDRAEYAFDGISDSLDAALATLRACVGACEALDAAAKVLSEEPMPFAIIQAVEQARAALRGGDN